MIQIWLLVRCVKILLGLSFYCSSQAKEYEYWQRQMSLGLMLVHAMLHLLGYAPYWKMMRQEIAVKTLLLLCFQRIDY